jgi:hypothetical protein
MTCAHSSSALRRSTAELLVGGAFAGWSATLGVIVVRTLVLPRRVGVLRRPAVPAVPDVVPATTWRAAALRG